MRGRLLNVRQWNLWVDRTATVFTYDILIGRETSLLKLVQVYKVDIIVYNSIEIVTSCHNLSGFGIKGNIVPSLQCASPELCALKQPPIRIKNAECSVTSLYGLDEEPRGCSPHLAAFPIMQRP